MAKYDVFISYSRLDTKIVDKICAAFDRAGITYFIDRQGLSTGMEFPVVLANAIMDSKVFLFVASRNAYESKFTNSEITFAFNKKPKGAILPYIIDCSTLPDHLQFIFSSINWRYRRSSASDIALINDLRSTLGNTAPYEPIPTVIHAPRIKYNNNIMLWTIFIIILLICVSLIFVFCLNLGFVIYGGTDLIAFFISSSIGSVVLASLMYVEKKIYKRIKER